MLTLSEINIYPIKSLGGISLQSSVVEERGLKYDRRWVLVDETYAKNKIVSFADGYPFLIIGQSSLDDLNSKLEKPLPMNRFRTNFVFTGGEPFKEDNWKKFKIENVNFEAVKPCARCVITTTDQDTAERFKEPLLTLSKFRNFNNKVLFGMNLVCESTGQITVGDKLELS